MSNFRWSIMLIMVVSFFVFGMIGIEHREVRIAAFLIADTAALGICLCIGVVIGEFLDKD